MKHRRHSEGHGHNPLDVELSVAEQEVSGRTARRDNVCADEVLRKAESDGAELQGSMLEVGAAIAGLMPIETPPPHDEGGSGCGGGC